MLITETYMITSAPMWDINKRLKRFNNRLFKRIRANSDNGCSREAYNEEESVRPVRRLSRSSSMITCAPSSVIMAASTSATGGQLHVTKSSNYFFNPYKYAMSAACAPQASDLSLCTAPSVIIPASESATMPRCQFQSHYYHNLFELGMDVI
jgi:hypothetical protein